MPNAWTLLKEYSSLDSGTAWEHLNSQEGGGSGGDPYPIGVTDVILDSDDVGNLFVEVDTEDMPPLPETQDGMAVPDSNKIEGMKRILPKYNIFPGPTNL